MHSRPLIGLMCDVKLIGQWDFHAVGDKYVQAIQHAVGDVILLPALSDEAVLARLLPLLDGVLLPGAYSNVAPHHYHGAKSRAGTLHDTHRDQTALPLIPMLINLGIPLLGICRGLQEINVALGGTLHQHVQELPHYLDHREPENTSIATQYADAHHVKVVKDSWLYHWLNTQQICVNSLHQQGIKDLAPGLTIEACASDGLIEAFRIDNAPIFGYAVQWHPEWQYDQNPVSIAVFKAFREACVQYKSEKSNF
ncbi:gamma-glutamyl-gamma-aminobutyrate hydrolase family protein [Neisseriaceae bacterium ESL0693]|nr:gamma-glutamyl-gamma-aminobutyrate hydrolase family protein [Neisseriaceae bacterium ESL0693]